MIVTFLLFDPKDPAIALPAGLRFISAREIGAPEFQDHLKRQPEHADWAFSFVELVRPKAWRLDGEELTLPDDGAIGVWFAPVDHSRLAADVSRDRYDAVIAPSPDALLVLGLWIPDRDYVAHMRARGHHAEYGMATLGRDGSGTFRGELRLTDLSLAVTATPHGEIRHEPAPFTQVFFTPGARVESVVILGGRDARERDSTAEWSKQGEHPLARGVFVGPTFVTREGPLAGSAYRVVEAHGR
ncbi:MAG: hypothetical protein AB7R55_13580 [Gemmatimonadales bacterium]